MTAINVVRFRVKAGMEDAFLDAHCAGKAAWPGLQGGRIVKSGERSYVLIGEWPNAAALAQARAAMIGTLDIFRHTLENLGEGRGVTDAASGEVVLTLK